MSNKSVRTDSFWALTLLKIKTHQESILQKSSIRATFSSCNSTPHVNTQPVCEGSPSRGAADVTLMEVLVCCVLWVQDGLYRITPMIDNTVNVPGAALTLLFLSSKYCGLKNAEWETLSVHHLFVTENTSLFEFSRSDTRNYALKAPSTQLNYTECMIWPSGWAISRAPRGASLLCEF